MSSRARRIDRSERPERFAWGGVVAGAAGRRIAVRTRRPLAPPLRRAGRRRLCDRAARGALRRARARAFAKGYAQGERAGVEAAATARRGDAAAPGADPRRTRRRCAPDLIRQHRARSWSSSSLAIAQRILQREVSLDHELLLGHGPRRARPARRRRASATHPPAPRGLRPSSARRAARAVASARCHGRGRPRRRAAAAAWSSRNSASSTSAIDAQIRRTGARALLGDEAPQRRACPGPARRCRLSRPLSRCAPTSTAARQPIRCRLSATSIRTVGLVVESNGPRAQRRRACANCAAPTAAAAAGGSRRASATARCCRCRSATPPASGPATASWRAAACCRCRSATACSAGSSTASAGPLDGLGPLSVSDRAPLQAAGHQPARRASRSSRRSAPACGPSTRCSPAAAASASACSAAAASARARCSA